MMNGWNVNRKGENFLLIPLYEPDAGILRNQAYAIVLMTDSSKYGYHLDCIPKSDVDQMIASATEVQVFEDLEEKVMKIASLWFPEDEGE
jgi:hypothetical protein